MTLDAVQTYVPGTTQGLFHASPARYRLLLGAWGAGKTYTLCWEDILLAMEYPGSLGVIYRATFPALRDTTKRDYLGILPPALVQREIKSEGREEIEFINGSRTMFRCLDDFRKLGSTQFDRVSVDEAWEIDDQSFKTLAYGRLRGKVGPRRMMLATNPPDEDHFLYQFFVAEAAADAAAFHLTTYDNAQYLPPGYIERLERMPPAWRRKFLLGQWGVLANGAGVFTGDFDETLHVGDCHPSRGLPVIRGWDFGFRRPACVWLQIDAQEHVTVLHELLGQDEPLRQFAGRVVAATTERFPGSVIEDFCDAAGNQRNDRGLTAVQILAREFGCRPSSRKMGIHLGVEMIRRLLHERRLRFDRGCRWCIKAMAGGYYIDRNTDEPAKDGTYDNMMDALRYALVPSLQLVTAKPSAYVGRPLPRPRWMMH